MTKKISFKNLPLLLSQSREAIISNFRPILHEYGLTEQQWRILRTLHEHDELEPREICDLAQILSPSLTGILKRMEEMQLITKKPDTKDKRRMWIVLTQKSIDMIAEMTPIIEKRYKEIHELYGHDLLDQLYETLDALLQKHSDHTSRK